LTNSKPQWLDSGAESFSVCSHQESSIYTIRTVPPERLTDAPGLTLYEAFVRMMALSGRAYMFTRTNWVMHLQMTDPPLDAPAFVSRNGSDWAARMEIAEQVCSHGLGEFQVVTDEQYHRERAGRAA
jgi:hypothetical protein